MIISCRRRLSHRTLVPTLLVMAIASSALGQARRPRTMTRIFWQDRESDKLSWADLVTAEKWSIERGWVKGFPKLDAAKQDLVQMKECGGVLMVGVRDHDSGNHQSGWVAIQTGVTEEPHGDHTHWKYTEKPMARNSQLDSEQGNPAHLYVYDRQFYLANDTNNGFTKAVPAQVANSKGATTVKFYPGGGNHITLAAVDNKVAYSSWIDGGGPNAGRVDVVDLQQDDPSIAYSFQLPTGVIHGATTNSGKVFLAPADGLCWVSADLALKQTADSVKVHHLDLGRDAESDKPLRTGAFTNSRNWVLFTTGLADQSALCLVNAALPEPVVTRVEIPVADGLRLTTPQTVLSLGKRYAFLFQDRVDGDSDVQEFLTVVELDPNRDRDYEDAKVNVNIPVGASKIEGHFGHHAVCFDAYGRYAVFTEPADGIINVMSLQSFKILARFRVGGVPDSIVAVGAPEHFH